MSFTDAMSRVPFFMYQDREHGTDAEATKSLGYEVPKMVTFILITPHGHRGDPMEFLAEEFIARKERESKDSRYDMQWVKQFKEGLELHRQGKALPRNGTPLITWSRSTKARREQLAMRYPTVEDLAAVPDSSVSDIGMDGRVMRDLARGDIQAKTDLSPLVKELAETKEDNRRLQAQIDSLMNRMSSFEEDKPARGRPRKEAAEA